uniref:Putative transcription factor IIIB subunit-like isoform X3 n=1 Tax=Davidia involucrata TaxID=16924 RepID=A0A5B7AKV9_DAVIN
MSTVADETDSFSDIDDVEVNGYLNNEEESRYKKIIWEEMNKEYLQEQATKEAAAAAAFKDVNVASDDLRCAQELAAAAAAAVAKSREKRRQKQALEAKNATPAQNAAEATCQMLIKKRLSSKINYDVLETLFDENLDPDAKRNRLNSDHDGNTTRQQLNEEENEADTTTNNDEPEQDDEDMEETVAKGEYNHEWGGFDNGEEVYDYDYDGYDESC